MTKEQSQILKGIAVLFMVWGHAFGRNVTLYTDPVSIFGKPCAQFLCGGMSPVSFFLVLGGYGLYHVYLRGNDKNRYKRIFRLYLHMWVILAIFIPIGAFVMHKPSYPGSFLTVLLNVSGLKNSYNSECWFLLPYSIVSVSSPFLFRFYDRFRAKNLIAATFAIYFLASTALHFYGEKIINGTIWLSLPTVLLQFQCSFSLGALLKRENFFDKVRNIVRKKNIKQWQVGAILMIGFLLMCSVWNTGYYPFYVVFFITCIVLLPLNNCVGYTLSYIGKHSMNIWMTHSFFCYHLFQSYTYSLKYPIVIFVALVIISLFCSYIVNIIVEGLDKIISFIKQFYTSVSKNTI